MRPADVGGNASPRSAPLLPFPPFRFPEGPEGPAPAPACGDHQGSFGRVDLDPALLDPDLGGLAGEGPEVGGFLAQVEGEVEEDLEDLG